MDCLTESDVYEYVRGICFKTGPPGLVGIETEWLATDPARPGAPVPLRVLTAAADAAGPLPAGSTVTFEPGGQVELSSQPHKGPAAATAALGEDLARLSTALDTAGVRLRGCGLDPDRPPTRQLRVPRYDAMDRYFAARGPAGRTMMCSTAALQVSMDIGADPDDAARRWRAGHTLGPLFTAAFANSPMWRGRPTGWKSTRWAVWAAMDSSRTRPPTEGGDPVRAWTRYALEARVMAIRHAGPWSVDPGLRLADWIAGGGPRRPTHADLEYHLTTLFPPVRPHGWLELRMIDMLPHRWWPVAVALVAALFDDPRAAETARRSAERAYGPAGPTSADRLTAARTGLAEPRFAAHAKECFEAAADALGRLDSAVLRPLVDEYRELFVERALSPADTTLLKGAA